MSGEWNIVLRALLCVAPARFAADNGASQSVPGSSSFHGIRCLDLQLWTRVGRRWLAFFAQADRPDRNSLTNLRSLSTGAAAIGFL